MRIIKAVVQSFDAGTYTASVMLIGSFVSYVEGVAVSRAIPAAEMVVNRYCAVLFFSDVNFSDGVLFAVYG